ncbi:MAG: AAA family ATPase, partial [Gemmatimonadetes bacterium]|nr:AAA family ATPase [Gemmatimonadota bacterium]
MPERPYVPPRFSHAVDQHLVFNLAGFDEWPLVLGVFGPPGDGKSFQIRAQLKHRGVLPVSINAADLESDRAGTPGKLVLDTYIDAGHRMDEGEPAAVLVDDFDTTVGEWEHSTTTVNHQQVLAQLMHLADSPTEVPGKRLRRVPIFITGNDLSKVYPPLRRPGRMRAFPWLPTTEERCDIVSAILADVLA